MKNKFPKAKEWLKNNGKESLGVLLDKVGENTSIPVISGIIEGVGESLMGEPDLTSDQIAEFNRIALEELSLHIQDRDSARTREVELAKTGKKDWLMGLTGVVLLGLLVYITISIINRPELEDNPLAQHLFGLIEGVVLSMVFYYFGSSIGSKQKTNLLNSK